MIIDCRGKLSTCIRPNEITAIATKIKNLKTLYLVTIIILEMFIL